MCNNMDAAKWIFSEKSIAGIQTSIKLTIITVNREIAQASKLKIIVGSTMEKLYEEVAISSSEWM